MPYPGVWIRDQFKVLILNLTQSHAMKYFYLRNHLSPITSVHLTRSSMVSMFQVLSTRNHLMDPRRCVFPAIRSTLWNILPPESKLSFITFVILKTLKSLLCCQVQGPIKMASLLRCPSLSPFLLWVFIFPFTFINICINYFVCCCWQCVIRQSEMDMQRSLSFWVGNGLPCWL